MPTITGNRYVEYSTSLGLMRIPYATADYDLLSYTGRVEMAGEFEGTLMLARNTSLYNMGYQEYDENSVLQPVTVDGTNASFTNTGSDTIYLFIGQNRTYVAASLITIQYPCFAFCVLVDDAAGHRMLVNLSFAFYNDPQVEAWRRYATVLTPQGRGASNFGYFVISAEAMSPDIHGSWPYIGPNTYYQVADEFLGSLSPVGPSGEDDPYAPGGISEPDAGDGTFDFTSQPVDFQNAPSIGAYDTGMISIYVPSASDLRSLASYLWAGAFDLENFRKLVADPMDAIIGLSILPVSAEEIGVTGSTLVVGNISTLLSMPRANRQYVVVDCGTVQILPKWGAYLDFAPYSKLQLFLPYIGFVDISPDDCMNGTISVKYTVDILSGTCVAQVKCKDHVLYEFSGTCSCSCPVTAGQYQNILLGAFRMAGALGSMAGAAVMNNIPGTANAITEAANTVLDSVKPTISRSGGFGGSSGLMGHQFPYLILTVPRLCLPERQNQMIGYPSYVTKTLGDVTGFCKIDVSHLAGIPASEDEQNEILELLKEGVYL